jgi:hypothetical protein
MRQLTPEEQRIMLMRQNAEALKRSQQMPQVNPTPQGSGQMSPAMMAGTVSPYVQGQASKRPRDLDSQEARYAQQMRMGQDLMTGDAPQGKSVSNGRIYVAPTWSENAANAS